MAKEPITIAQCAGPCKVFDNLQRMFYSNQHVFCEKDKPEGAIPMRDILLAAAYGASPEAYELKLREKNFTKAITETLE